MSTPATGSLGFGRDLVNEKIPRPRPAADCTMPEAVARFHSDKDTISPTRRREMSFLQRNNMYCFRGVLPFRNFEEGDDK